MCVRSNSLCRGGVLGLVLATGSAWAEEPPARSVQEVVEIVIEKAADAAQGIASQAATEAQRAAAAIASEAAALAEAAATEAAGEAARALDRAVVQVGIGGAAMYHIDLSVVPVPAALAAQLKLEDRGVLVDRVDQGGPADAAGIKTHDVLIAVDGEPIRSAKDLAAAVVKSEGKELQIELLRGGESMKVQVRPRSSQATLTVPLPKIEIEEEIINLESKIREKLKNAGVDVRMQLIRPGHVLPPNTFIGRAGAELPEDVTIVVRRKGSEPVEITVTRGDDKWTVTGDKVDELPEDLRPYVNQMLGRGPFTFTMQMPAPAVPGVPAVHGAPPIRIRQFSEAYQDAFERQLQDLEKYYKPIRSKQSELLEQLEQRARQQEANLKSMTEMVERLSKQVEKLLQSESEQEEEEVVEEKAAEQSSEN